MAGDPTIDERIDALYAGPAEEFIGAFRREFAARYGAARLP